MFSAWLAARAQRRAKRLYAMADATRDGVRRANLRDHAYLAECRALYLTGRLSPGGYAAGKANVERALKWRNRTPQPETTHARHEGGIAAEAAPGFGQGGALFQEVRS